MGDKTSFDKGFESDDFYDEHDFEDTELEDRRGAFALLLGTSYGISALVHLIALFALTLVLFFTPSPKKKAVVLARREVKPQKYDEKLERDLYKKPKILDVKPIEKPIIDLQEEVEITKEVPQGTSFDNLSTKNLDSSSVVDAYAVGGGAAGAFGDRRGKGKLRFHGGDGGTEKVVTSALRWLERHQSPDGRWSAAHWQDNCRQGRCSGPGENRGFDRYDVGVSSLALLAYLGNGHTHRFGVFKRTVNKGLRWLMAQQKPDGSIGFDHTEDIYNHAIATMALCEAFAVSRDFKLKKFAQRAVDYCIQAQNPNRGWKYGIKPGSNDTSVTGWMVLALKAARTGGIEVPDSSFEGARSWFHHVTDSQSGRAGYSSSNGVSSAIEGRAALFDPTPCMTSVAVVCRIFAGERRSLPELRRGAELIAAAPPSYADLRKVNFYYWYYGSYALFQVGGQKWRSWNKAMKKALVARNRQGGCEDGSWDPVGEWCIAGGRVYATAINALTLEIYYRNERVGEK